MWRGNDGPLARAKRQFIADYTADPWLRYILALAVLLTGFWFWHRIPNFATRDERWRLVDPMMAIGALVNDFSLSSLQQGIVRGRAYGATFYLYGIILIPVFVAAAITGQLDAFTIPQWHGAFDLWYQWNQTPRWIWTWSLLLARFINVLLAVGCVYLTYRIGVMMRDRPTGRLAAVLLTLTFGFFVLAHEAGEDIPALFCLLLTIYFAFRYIETGDETTFLIGCIVGGIAIALKLTTGVSVVLLGTTFLLRARTENTDWYTAVFRPYLLVIGAIFGMGAIIVGFPSVLVAGMDILTDRLLGGASRAIAKEDNLRKSSWWWLLRSYLSGFGLPLFIAALGGVVTGIVHLRDQSSEGRGSILMLTGLAAYLLVFSQWEYVRVHHLLPTFPLLMLLAATALVRLWEHNRTIARPLIAVLLVTSATYAAAGNLHYVTKPRGEATDWVQREVPPNATIEVYTVDPQDAAIPHGMQISRYRPQSTALDGNPSHHDKLTRVEWIVNMPERCPAYIQLNYHPDFATLTPDNRDGRSQQRSPQSPRARYVYDLLAGDTYAYRVAATFGPQPPFLAPKQGSARLPELLRAGLLPWSLLNYGDDQDSGIGQYTVLLERTGSCDADRGSPYQRHNVKPRL